MIFNIKGGYFRLVTWIDYDRKLVSSRPALRSRTFSRAAALSVMNGSGSWRHFSTYHLPCFTRFAGQPSHNDPIPDEESEHPSGALTR